MASKAPTPRKHKNSTVKAKVGLLVHVDGHPGAWQIAMQGPGRSEYWCIPWDDAARTDGALFQGHLLAHLMDMDPAKVGGR